MKRLGIFCFYDTDGIVDEYIEYILTELIKVLDKLIIVVNGIINDKSKKKFEKYTNQIILRENKGFDAGAYRYVIVDILGEEKIKEWDEIVLCNDTFYGPFIPFEKIFQEMASREIDFWGIDYREGKFLSFIQSYFLVFRKNIIRNGILFRYLRDNICLDSMEISDVYALFEVGLFSCLVKQKYKYDTFVYTENHDVYFNGDRCIEEYKLPILKKKCFSPQYYSEEPIIRIIKFIQKNFNYNIRHILENIQRLYGIMICTDKIASYNFPVAKSLERRIPDLIVDENMFLNFIQEYKDIYIYGTGIIARKIWHLFHLYIKEFKGYIISDEQNLKQKVLYGYPVIHYKDVGLGSAIILGMGDKNSKEVIPKLKKEDHVLILWEEDGEIK